MIIKTIAIGNKSEAFIETRITGGLNIIFSDDNNRGKTIIIQGMMYSLGYDSIFPSTFNYKDYYFYIHFILNGYKFEILRKHNTVILKENDTFQVFNTVRDFRYYYDQNIGKLPRIIKDGKKVMVSFSMLYEIFFVGQDNRFPAGLISSGQFNKKDFTNMLFTINGLSSVEDFDEEYDDLKKERESLEIELRAVRRKISIAKKNPNVAKLVSKTKDSEEDQRVIKICKEYTSSITDLQNSKRREINRKIKLELLIKELTSLNRELTEGNVVCGDCGSEKIIYKNNDMKFEISNSEVRKKILESIKNNIDQKDEIINELTLEINRLQELLQKEMQTVPVDFKELVLFHDEIISDVEYDNKAYDIKTRVDDIKEKIEKSRSKKSEVVDSRTVFLNQITSEMYKLYKEIDPNGNLEFNDVFAKRDSTFSGSEEQEYYFCRTISINNILKHKYPIIIDSFRDGELSSKKEEKMLNLYSNLSKQIILTATLKQEEYAKEKYTKDARINAIDYSKNQDCKILTTHYNDDFKKIIDSFGVDIN